VPNEEDITRLVPAQDQFDLADDPRLCIGCSLPTPNAGERVREEVISHHLELSWLKEARSRSIVLMHRFSHFDSDPQFVCNDLGRFDRFPLFTRNNLRSFREPSFVTNCFSAGSADGI
jgi:hypothetical protein